MWRMVSSELDSTVVWLAASPLRTVGRFEHLVAEAVPLAEQQQALVVEHLRVDGFPWRSRDGRRASARRTARHTAVGQHIGFLERQRDDDRVQFAGAQLVAQDVGEVLFDVQQHVRSHAGAAAGSGAEHVGADGIDGTDLSGAASWFLPTWASSRMLCASLQHLLRLGDDAFAHGGQAHGALGAFEDQYPSSSSSFFTPTERSAD